MHIANSLKEKGSVGTLVVEGGGWLIPKLVMFCRVCGSRVNIWDSYNNSSGVVMSIIHTTNLSRRVFCTYRLHDRLPTYAERGMTNKVT